MNLQDDPEVTRKINSLLTGAFRTHAVKTGWTKDLADAVTVRFDGDNFEYVINPAYKEKVDNAEYGDGSSGPKRAMFTFTHEASEIIADVADEAIMDYIFGEQQGEIA